MTIMSDAAFARVDLRDALPRRSDFAPLPLVFKQASAVSASPPESVDAYARGFDEGHRVASEAFATDRQHLLSLLAKAETFQPEASDELAAMIAETVFRLVAEIVGSVEIDRALLDRRIDEAMKLIADCDAARTLAFHPDDLPLLANAGLTLDLIADPSLARGDLRIDCSSGGIEHGNSIYLDALRSELGIDAGDCPRMGTVPNSDRATPKIGTVPVRGQSPDNGDKA
jgi:flagellar assembly protein FliH